MTNQYPYSNLWLDLLPDEICHSIAARATRGQPNAAALSLSNVSRKQRLAVSNLLLTSQPLHLNFDNYYDGVCREIEIANYALAFPHIDAHLSFRSFSPYVAKALSYAKVTNCSTHRCRKTFGIRTSKQQPTELFRKVVAKDTIRSLSMNITEHIDITETFLQLSKMNLEELYFYGELPVRDIYELASSCNLLSTCCPNLRLISLSNIRNIADVEDGMWIFDEAHGFYWTAIENLPRCCAVYLPESPPKRLVNRLNQFRGLDAEGLAPIEAAAFGARLRCFRFTSSALNGRELEALGQCPILEEVDICFVSGTTWCIRDFLRRCRSVRILKITAMDFLDIVNDIALNGVLVDIAREGRNVQDLSLGGTVFQAQEWKDALKIFGGRLVRLSICFGELFGMGRFDDRVNVLEGILESITKYNLQLKYFLFTNLVCPYELKSHGELRMKYVRHLLKRVRDAIPLLNEGKLGSLFGYEINRFAGDRSERKNLDYSFDCRGHYYVRSCCDDNMHERFGICPWPGQRWPTLK